MAYILKFDQVLYQVAGKRPPSRMVLSDGRVVQCAWTYTGNGAQAYDIDEVKHDKKNMKPWQVADALNLPLAQRIDSN